MDIDVSALIRGAVKDTAKRFNNENIRTAKDMIPHMRDYMKEEDYPKRYLEDVSYAESKEAKMDIYFPEGFDGPRPVFVEVHGGAWYFGQKSSVEFRPFLHGLERGYVCVSLGYTLSPDAIYPQAVIELKQAIDFLKKNADRYNIDPDRIVLWGGSAGAHLAALATYSTYTGYLGGKEELDNTVKALILWYGCHNYYLGKKLDGWIYNNFFGTGDLTEVSEQLILSNPACHVTEDIPFTLLQHGMDDVVVPYEQSVYLYNIIKSIAGEDKCKLELLEGCNHADVKMFANDFVVKMFDIIDEKIV